MNPTKSPWWVWLLPLPLVWWAALLCAGVWAPGNDFTQVLGELSAAMEHPFAIHWTGQSPKSVLIFTMAYAFVILLVKSNRKHYRRGEEHGSAAWGDVFQITKRYRDASPSQNLILTQNFRLGLDGHKHRRNLNVLVLGGSGAGKSRSYAIPNVMQCNCSMVITDPKGGATRS